MIKVLHLITGLSTGGAELMLSRLVSHFDTGSFDTEIISLTDIDAVGKHIQASGVQVRPLGMTRGVPNPISILKLARWLRIAAPNVIQTWMYHSDLIRWACSKIGW